MSYILFLTVLMMVIISKPEEERAMALHRYPL
jgi:hypothetical protein